MRKIIVTSGYMGSGSSAATRLVSEFKNVNNKHKEFEYIFLHCPNGVFDLEDKLLVGNNSIRSDEAIHSFLDTMRDLYDKKFYWPGYYKKIIGEEFYAEVLKYVNKLVDVRQKNFWYYQENPTKPMQAKKFFNELVARLTLRKVKLKKPVLYEEMLLSYKTPEEFYKESKKFIENVLNLIDKDGKDILLDQLLLPHNLHRIDNYFGDNLRVIVVERDPRDVFVLNKYAWGLNGDNVPYSFDVKEFCNQYKSLRALEKKDKNKKILRIKFEDLVYNYEKTKNKIMKFLDYKKEDHINEGKVYSVMLSKRNTQVFLSDKKYKKEIDYIEKNLKEFLYDFPEKIVSKIEDTVE